MGALLTIAVVGLAALCMRACVGVELPLAVCGARAGKACEFFALGPANWRS
jgi:hypothetical protein